MSLSAFPSGSQAGIDVLLPYSRIQRRQSDLEPRARRTGRVERRKLERTLPIFRKYGERYHLDPLLLAAMGYQESRLVQSTRSPAGAIGVMQLLPSDASRFSWTLA